MPKAKPTPTTRAAPKVTYDARTKSAVIFWEGRETTVRNCTRESAHKLADRMAQHATPTGMLYTRPKGLGVTR